MKLEEWYILLEVLISMVLSMEQQKGGLAFRHAGGFTIAAKQSNSWSQPE